jgi:NAD(P)-dependent dehydrogenase (short-subunit alcohol dehydrogenase family)
MSRNRSHLITNARGNSRKTLHKIMKSKKVAVLTRAANGISQAIAIEFARKGYTVMINDIVERQLQQTVESILSSLSETKSTKKRMKNNDIIDYNDCISYFTGDTSKEEVSISLIEETIKRFGRIDVLINNATISQQSIASQSYEMGTASTNSSTSINYGEQGRSSPYFTLEEYEIVDTNLKGIYFCIRELVKQLLIYKNLNADGTIDKNKITSNHNIDTIKKADYSIINIASCYNSIPSSQVEAYTFSQSGIDPFTSSRSSIKSLTESVALQLADKGIRVNAIAPGIIDSDISSELLKDQEKKNQVERAIPFQRIGRAQEIAKVALFLASEAASYVTGTMIYSDGGISLRDSNMVRSS